MNYNSPFLWVHLSSAYTLITLKITEFSKCFRLIIIVFTFLIHNIGTWLRHGVKVTCT
jgi:hypothetical protein